jgi:excisionase family DNA binding protein
MPTTKGQTPNATAAPAGPWLDWNEAGEYLGVTKRWLRRRVDRRELPFHKFGRLIKFHVADLDAYIAENRIEATK